LAKIKHFDEFAAYFLAKTWANQRFGTLFAVNFFANLTLADADLAFARVERAPVG